MSVQLSLSTQYKYISSSVTGECKAPKNLEHQQEIMESDRHEKTSFKEELPVRSTEDVLKEKRRGEIMKFVLDKNQPMSKEELGSVTDSIFNEEHRQEIMRSIQRETISNEDVLAERERLMKVFLECKPASTPVHTPSDEEQRDAEHLQKFLMDRRAQNSQTNNQN